MQCSMLLVCIRSSLKPVVGHTFLISVTYHLGTLYLHERGCEDPWLFFDANKSPQAKKA